MMRAVQCKDKRLPDACGEIEDKKKIKEDWMVLEKRISLLADRRLNHNNILFDRIW